MLVYKLIPREHNQVAKCQGLHNTSPEKVSFVSVPHVRLKVPDVFELLGGLATWTDTVT